MSAFHINAHDLELQSWAVNQENSPKAQFKPSAALVAVGFLKADRFFPLLPVTENYAITFAWNSEDHKAVCLPE